MQKSVLHECQKLSSFDRVGTEFLMQDRHGRELTESVMLGAAFQTSWVMKNLHDKFTLFQTQTFLQLIRQIVLHSDLRVPSFRRDGDLEKFSRGWTRGLRYRYLHASEDNRRAERGDGGEEGEVRI